MAVPALAQTPPPAAPSTQAPQAQAPAGLLKIFLDCNRCDEDYMRQNVAFVEYVRDRAVADVHVLVTTQETGGGGLSWVVKFIGLGRLQGQDRELTFSTTQTATDDDRRKEFARIFRFSPSPTSSERPSSLSSMSRSRNPKAARRRHRHATRGTSGCSASKATRT